MAVIAIRNFSGEIPRLPPHLLPEGAAQDAVNCDFARGQLAPLKGGQSQWTWTGASAIGSFFTDDAVNWVITPTSDVTFHKSPVIDEQYRRYYFLWSDGIARVDQLPENAPSPNGAQPSTATYLGVPAPTTAPTLTLNNLTTIPGLANPTWSFRYWYEASGVRYQEAAVSSVSTVTANQEWTFTPATLNTGTAESPGTPAQAALVVEATLKDGTKEIFRLNTATAATLGARSSALPGGVELSISKSGSTITAKVTWGPVDTRAYCYTLKNSWGEESAPSPASLVSPTYIQSVTITLTGLPSFTNYRARAAGVSGVGIYRTFGGSADYISCAVTESVAGTAYVDAVHTPANVGTTLKSANWNPPPTTLTFTVGMHITPNGWFVAAKGNTLYMSEPYRPHAWPYSMTFPKTIRGICVGSQGVVVTTSEATYVVYGPHPASATQQKLSVPVGGISSKSMCNVEGGVAMLTNDGIMLVNGTQASLAEGQRLFTRDDWRGRYDTRLSAFRLAYFDGKLLGCLNAADTTSNYGFVLRTDENQAAGNLSKTNVPITAVTTYASGDALYYTTNAEATGRVVYSYGAGQSLTASWWSKDFIFPQPETMGLLYVRTAGALTITIYRDGVQLKKADGTDFSISASATGYYRLPAVGPAVRWSIKLSALSGPVYEVLMANSAAEMKRG